MHSADKLLNTLQSWAGLLTSPASLIQFALIAVAFIAAFLLNKRLRNWITGLIGEEGSATIKSLAVRGSLRLFLPLTMLMMLIVFKSIMVSLNREVWLFDIFVPLLVSLAIIRITVFLIRRAYTPSPLIRAWESIISTTIWVIVVLHLIGILPDITELLDQFAVSVGEKRVSILDVIQVTLSVIIFLLLATWLSRVIENRVMASRHLGISMRLALSKTIKIVLLSLAILIESRNGPVQPAGGLLTT